MLVKVNSEAKTTLEILRKEANEVMKTRLSTVNYSLITRSERNFLVGQCS